VPIHEEGANSRGGVPGPRRPTLGGVPKRIANSEEPIYEEECRFMRGADLDEEAERMADLKKTRLRGSIDYDNVVLNKADFNGIDKQHKA